MKSVEEAPLLDLCSDLGAALTLWVGCFEATLSLSSEFEAEAWA